MSTSRPVQGHQNGLGTAALVLGIIALIVCLVPILGVVGLPLAVIGLGLSIPALMRARSGRASNRGSAVAGLVLSILALLLSIVWIAVSLFAADAVNTATDGTTGTTTSDTRQAGDDSKSVKLGETVVIDDFAGQGEASFTVDEFNDKAATNNELLQASDGNRLVGAHVVVKNDGDQPYTNVSWVGAKVYTQEGQGYDTNPMYESGEGRALPSSIDLKAGGSIDGWILFEVPEDAKVTSIVFDDAEWTL